MQQIPSLFLRNVRAVLWLPVAALSFASAVTPARAEPKYLGWTKVEGGKEIKEINEKLKDGGQFDDNARLFLKETVLPQLALEENRPLIERTRKRIRDVLLPDVAEEKAYRDISQLVAEEMMALARDDQADPVVRVNAMLLVGELKSKDKKPWATAAPMLAAAAADQGLTEAVRIAALAGILVHATAAPGSEGVVKTFGPPVAAILGEAVTPERSVEQDWLVSRAVQIVPALARPAPAPLAATLAGLLTDESRSIDLRVRAAAALGATVDATSGVDAAALVETIRALAVTALDTEARAAETRRFEEQYKRGGAPLAGGPPPGSVFEGQPQPVMDPLAIPEQACRRAAWRLHTLGTAIVSADGKQGLAPLLGDAGEPAKKLSKQLIEEAMTIDRYPMEDSVLDALDVFRPPVPGEKAVKRADREPKPDEQGADRNKPADNPNASPFDNPFQ